MKKLLSLFTLLLLPFKFSYAFDWQGHRGARGLYPENTIGAMKEALKYPVTTLELDVVISGDEKVVVSHEPWMNEDICKAPGDKEIKGREYNLFKMNYSEIMKFDCGSKPNSRFPGQHKAVVGKPLLSKLLAETEDLLKQLDRKVKYNVEIKSSPDWEKQKFQPDYRKFADMVVKAMSDALPPERFLIQSFDWRVLKYIHEKYPAIKVSALREGSYTPGKVLEELGFVPEVFSPYYKYVTPEDLKFFHAKVVKVIPWTVNTVEEMQNLKKMGVDGIITDYPNLIAEVERKTCGKGYNYFEGECVKVPTHALPSERPPGWICKEGYVQRRGHCRKLSIPAHARPTEDGKSWVCKEGYERYRGSCKKAR